MAFYRLLLAASLGLGIPLTLGCSSDESTTDSTSASSSQRETAQADDEGSKERTSGANSAFPPLDAGPVGTSGNDDGDDSQMPSPFNPLPSNPATNNPATGGPAGSPNSGLGGNADPMPQDLGANAGSQGGREIITLPGSRPGTGFNAVPLTIPDGGTNELLAFVAQIDQRVGAIAQRGVSSEETLNEIGGLWELKNTALDRLLAPGIDEQTRIQMLGQKLKTLQQMTQIRHEGADAKYFELLQSMTKDLNPMVLTGARMRLIEYYAVKLFENSSDEAFENLRESILLPLKETEVAPQTVQMIQGVIQQMFLSQERERAKQLLAEVAPVLIGHPRPEMKEVGNAFLDQLMLAQLDFDEARINVFTEEPGAVQVLIDRAEQVLTGRPLSPFTLDTAIDAARTLEISHNFAESLQLYERITQVAQASGDPVLETTASRSDRRAKIRLNLVGQPLELEGKMAGGVDFDWASYRGKVVLVVFWESHTKPALDEFDTIRDLRSKYRQQGFDVVGVNLDGSAIEAEQFLTTQPVPWVNLISNDPDRVGFEAPMANRLGVDVLPFHVLVDREGKVIDMHIYHYRNDLQIQVGLALGIDPAELPERITGPPKKQEPAEGEAPAGDQGTDGAAGNGGATGNDAAQGTDGAGASEAPASNAAPDGANSNDEPGMSRVPMRRPQGIVRRVQWISAPALNPFRSMLSTALLMPNQDDADQEAAQEENPYLAPADASTAELVDFLLDLQDKPRSLQNRAALVDAIAEAADRILSDAEARLAHRRIAALEKLAALHRKAWDDDAVQTRLVACLDQVAGIEDARVQKEVAFLRLEAEALSVDESLSAEQRLALLERLKTFFQETSLEGKHLRLASASIGIVNDLSGDDEKQVASERETWFKSLGELWSKSEDRQLAGYGRRIAAAQESQESSVVGTELQLAGKTQSGLPFDMQRYRGKVVVVDFWATWCGPCRREMPNVEKAYAELHEQGMEIIGVSLDQDEQALSDFLGTHPLPWETLSGDDARSSATAAGVRAIPTMMLLDREGKVVAIANRIDQLRPQIEQLLAQPSN